MNVKIVDGSIEALAADLMGDAEPVVDKAAERERAEPEAEDAGGENDFSGDKPDAGDAGAEPESSLTDQAEEDVANREDAEDAEGDEPEVFKVDNPKVQARIDSLTARRKAAEAELAELKAKLAAAEAGAGEPKTAGRSTAAGAESPLADVWDDAGLDAKRDNALTVQRWALLHPDGGVIQVQGADGKLEEREVSAEEAREWAVNAQEMLTLHLPARERYLAEHAKISQDAQSAYPELFQAGTPEAQDAETILARWPEIKRFPDWQLILGDMIRGGKSRVEGARKAQSAKDAPKPKAKPAPRAPRVPEPVTVGEPRPEDASGRALERAARTGGDLDAIAESLM